MKRSAREPSPKSVPDSRAHVRAFFADFRELSEEFIAALPWSGAGASLRVAATA